MADRRLPLALALAAVLPAAHADWRIAPTFGLTETYTDNVSLRPRGQEVGSWVTDVAPGLAVIGRGPRLQLTAAVDAHLFAYGGTRQPNTRDSLVQYQANAQAKVIDDLLFVDAYAARAAQPVSPLGQQAGSLWSTGNRAEVSTWRLSPWLRHRFGSAATATVRYARDGVDGGLTQLGKSTSDSVAANLAGATSAGALGWSLDYNQQDLDHARFGHSSSRNALASLRWHTSRSLSVLASAGHDSFDYQGLGGSSGGGNWSVGLAWTPSPRTRVEASWGHRFFGPSGSLAASHRSRHSIWYANYSDTIVNSRAQFTLPAAVDTASLLDKLFASAIPDPLLRADAVAAYIRASGLPPSLADSINFFSNRYYRQRQGQLGMLYTGARSALSLGLFDTRRNAQSVEQSDGTLVGSQLSEINADTRQRGAAATLNYRLSPRTAALLTANVNHIESLSTGRRANTRVLKAGLRHQLTPRALGALELRRASGSAGLFGEQRYAENALSASLSIQL